MSTMTYHWACVDVDNQLCVRMIEDSHCEWSGGFRIDRIQSFHVNMRYETTSQLFISCSVVRYVKYNSETLENCIFALTTSVLFSDT